MMALEIVLSEPFPPESSTLNITTCTGYPSAETPTRFDVAAAMIPLTWVPCPWSSCQAQKGDGVVVGTEAWLKLNSNCPPFTELAELPPEFMKSGCVQSAPVSSTATFTLPAPAVAAVRY